MAGSKDGGEQGPGDFLSLRPADMSISRDEEDHRHLLTDDQFDRLCSRGGDTSLEVCLGLFGAGLGLLQNVISTLVALRHGAPVAGADVILAMICFACFAGAFAKFTEHQKARRDMETLRSQIKNRPTVRIRS